MGNKIVTIITSFVLLVSFILMVAFISTDTQNDKSKQLVREFTETVRYKGYITYDQYTQLINSIPYKNIKVQITHIVNNGNDEKEFAPGTLDMRFTSQIIGDEEEIGYPIRTANGIDIYSGTLLYSGSHPATDEHIYKMQTGDQIQIDLFVMEGTFFDSLVSAFTRVESPSIKILTSASGVVMNEKYSKVHEGDLS